MTMTVPEWDDYLRSMTPEQVEELNRSIPADIKDRMRSAERKMREQVESLPGTCVVKREVPEWIRLSMMDTVMQWAKGNAVLCMHQPDMLHPQPLYMAAWKPGMIVCGHCAHMLVADADQDFLCDFCGGEADPIQRVVVQAGAMQFFAGVCVQCGESM